MENAISGKTWNEAAKCAAVKQVTRPPPRPVKAVELTTAPSPGTFKQYTLLDQLSDAVKAQTKPSDNTMIIDEPVKPVAGSSKHPDDMDVIDGELIYLPTVTHNGGILLLVGEGVRYHISYCEKIYMHSIYTFVLNSI